MQNKKNRTMKRPPLAQGLPSREDILQFIQIADGPVGKREIAKAFGLKGQEKIALKARLKDMAEEGLIDGKRTAYHRMGGLPKVTVLKIVAIEDGEPVAEPESWESDKDRPRLRLIEKKGQPALKRGDRVLARCEETPKGWRAHPMKKLPARTEGLMGVVEIDKSGKGWLAPVDKRVRNASPIADLGEAKPGELVLADLVDDVTGELAPERRAHHREARQRAGRSATERAGDGAGPRVVADPFARLGLEGGASCREKRSRGRGDGECAHGETLQVSKPSGARVPSARASRA